MRPHRALAPIALCLVPLLAGSCGPAAPAAPHVEGAWVRAADSAAVTAAYFTIVNGGADSLHVTGVTGDCAEALAMHESVREGGMVSMRPVDRLEVAPGARLAFAPGGRHVMLTGLRRRLAPGAHVNLALHVSGRPDLAIVAEVKP